MPDLFEPVSIGTLTLNNRIVRSATWDNTADHSGAATADSESLFRELGRFGIGLIVTGHAFVSVLGQATTRQYGIHTDAMLPGLRRIVRAAHEGGAKIAVQITHCGVNSGYLRSQGIPVQVVSRRENAETPQEELTDVEIEAIIGDFASASRRAVEAGFDAVQIHGAHGYLLSQFLSPLSNHRTDRWGGSPERRRRFHLEVVAGVRRAVGSGFPVLIKFGIQEDREGGLTLDEGIETAVAMVQQGIDALEISGGDGRSAIPRRREGEPEETPFRTRASALRKAVGVPVILVGGIRTPETAKDILESGDADMISMCRPFIREPGLALRWQRSGAGAARCISCNKCMPTGENLLSCGQERLAA
jgi:2,4-dienoyl-CoA reductase-like NADH-dependent reductase (Old Yellow Enzyme family)